MQDRTVQRSSEADAWLALSLVPGLGPQTARSLATRHGGPEAVLALGPTALREAGVGAEAIAAWNGGSRQVVIERAALTRAGATLVAWSDAAYPARLREIADPPLVLAVRGELHGDEPSVAIVGARRAGAYGRRVAEELARGLAQSGVTVVSGLAAGIDAAAHRGALDGGGRTIAVLGTGVDRVYPSWNATLATTVAGQGALVSEFACGTDARPWHFPRRNRIISGLTLGTIVVEAAERSGSLITARYALEQGREVFAVPGPLGVALHQGPHRLIQQGALLVTSADDVLDAVAPMLRSRLIAARVRQADATVTAGERRLLDALVEGVRHVDDLVRTAAVSADVALETLLALELRGLVEQQPGARYRLRRQVAA
jgi:DNA processing protein